MSSLSTNDVVTVTVSVAPSAPTARNFSNALILGSATVLPLYQRVQAFAGGAQVALAAMVAAGFTTTMEEYKAAAIWFSQSPQPQTIKIGRRMLAAQPGALLGAGVSSTPLATFQAITAGGFDIALNGTNEQVAGLNFAGLTMTQIAAAIQTALQALLASTLCIWNGTSFIVTSPTTGTSSTVGYAVAPTHSGSPTDISVLLGLTAGSGAQGYAGVAIESMTDSWNASAIFDPNFYGIAVAGGSTQDIKDTMAWGQIGVYLHAYSVSDPTAKLAATTTDLFSYAKTNGYSNSFGQWSNTPYAALSALSRLLLVDLTQPNSAITLKFKQEPGVAVDSFTETERLALEGKNANYYASFAAPGTTNGFAMFAQGVCGDGTFIDQVFNLAWCQANLQSAYFGVLATALTKIAQTDIGVQMIVQALDKVMDQARAAGIIAKGNWTGLGVGEIKSGDLLPNAYYTYASPVASQSSGDRAARKAPPITIIATGAGAVHSGSVQFNFQA